MTDHDHIESATNAGDGPFNPAGELVRFAEKLIEQGDVAQALECLHEALTRQPDNLYITAVIQRAEKMRGGPAHSQRAPQQKPLTVTVDSRQPSGVRQEPAESPGDVDARIRRLTMVAGRLFDRGAFDAAFESLMKAYLLDPGNPLVVACEKQMMPVWNTLRKTGLPGYSPQHYVGAGKVLQAPPPVVAQSQPLAPVATDAEVRLELRKRQLEQQRKDHEQTIWRNASQAPKNMASRSEKGKPAPPPRPATPRLRDLDKYDRPNLLRWLKGG
jgi:tetratricopeptide (TPR) repeat protein